MPPVRPRGQAAVELLALLPFVALAAWIAWQMVVAGHALTLAGAASRAGVRAQEVGVPARQGAERALPPGLASRAAVTVRGGRVRVRLAAPWLPAPVAAEAAP